MIKSTEARAAVKALADEIAALAAKDELTEEDEARFAAIEGDEGEFAKAEAELARAVKREELEARARKHAEEHPEHIERGDGSGTPAPATRRKARKGVERFATAQIRSMSTSELRGRAFDAIEDTHKEVASDSNRERVTTLVERGAISPERVLVTSTDEYREEFAEYLASGHIGPALSEARATLTTFTAGTTAVPWYLDPTLIFTGAGTQNPFRQLARNVQLGETQGNAWHGLTQAQVSAEWIAENTQVADASVAPGGVTIPVYKADAHVQATFEFLQDTVGFVPEITAILADAKDRLEGTAFAVGTGSGQPTGIVTALQAVTASRTNSTTNGSFGIADPTALVAALPPRFRGAGDVAWVADYSVLNLIRGFVTTYGIGSYFAESLQVDVPPKLLGRPIYQSSDMKHAPLSAATASNDDILVVGSWHNYVIVDKMGADIKYNDNVMGANLRPVGAVAWTLFWRVGADCPNPAAFQLLRV